MLLLEVDWTVVIAFYMEFRSIKLGNCNVLCMRMQDLFIA